MSEVSGDGYDGSDATPNEGATGSETGAASGDAEVRSGADAFSGQEADTGADPDHDLDKVAAPDDEAVGPARNEATNRAGPAVVRHEVAPELEPAEDGVEVTIDHTDPPARQQPDYAAEIREKAARDAELLDRSTEHRDVFSGELQGRKEDTSGGDEPELSAADKARLIEDTTKPHYSEDSEDVDSGQAASGDAAGAAEPAADPADRAESPTERDYAAEVREQAARDAELHDRSTDHLAAAGGGAAGDSTEADALEERLDAAGIPKMTPADIASAQQGAKDAAAEVADASDGEEVPAASDQDDETTDGENVVDDNPEAAASTADVAGLYGEASRWVERHGSLSVDEGLAEQTSGLHDGLPISEALAAMEITIPGNVLRDMAPEAAAALEVGDALHIMHQLPHFVPQEDAPGGFVYKDDAVLFVIEKQPGAATTTETLIITAVADRNDPYETPDFMSDRTTESVIPRSAAMTEDMDPSERLSAAADVGGAQLSRQMGTNQMTRREQQALKQVTERLDAMQARISEGSGE